jgi:hypothetical protein
MYSIVAVFLISFIKGNPSITVFQIVVDEVFSWRDAYHSISGRNMLTVWRCMPQHSRLFY